MNQHDSMIRRVLCAASFELTTFRLGAYILLLTCLVLPLGQHRIWIRQPGWWLFPSSAAVSGAGLMLALGYGGVSENPAFLVFSMPFIALFHVDLYVIWSAKLPTSNTRND
ncbi:hypothetical protein HMPREF0004_1477 [Achromobacter piechaudii ATCC 43553]|uniref:Uncharacterized protein n=1 Tax=Achromobacter piechaudii ATCC 43553 TaxID=742159 RepID=D4X7N0_9BURK|nr:hypothetical protein [Achromobacter insuavis]EFF77176.1 hypothetical protein HMPREF0004_1477 [Achromobacter piechaudii ATCC 43553]